MSVGGRTASSVACGDGDLAGGRTAICNGESCQTSDGFRQSGRRNGRRMALRVVGKDEPGRREEWKATTGRQDIPNRISD